jgi:hypothetical protein
MGNTCELLINVVTSDKPKWLIGLNQKVSGSVFGLIIPDTPDDIATGG